jgi:O-acetyl-ADP-ribose deacetylase (regulator of RNase III)
MKIQLIDTNTEMCAAWERHFKDCNITILCEDIFSSNTDCVVSPGNSFGFMDGGIDVVLEQILNVQSKLQMQINENYNGELLVGQAILVETENIAIPFLIAAPTMRVPMILGDSPNVYLASRALFILLKQNEDRFNSVSIPGFGTGVGKMSCDIAARQMKKAFDDIWLNKYVFPMSWYDAQIQHQLLYSNNWRDLQEKP